MGPPGYGMERIAFCGLGRMGTPMAGRLLDAGHHVVVWNRTLSKATPLGRRGAHIAADPREAAEGCRIAITMLADEGAVQDVVLGPSGLASATRPPAVVVEMSTIGPEAVASLRSGLQRDIALVDAPVLGSIPQAEAGELQVFAAGSLDDIQSVRPVLDALGHVRVVGSSGAGASLKLAVNSTLGAVMVTVAEALALGQCLGISREILLDVLRGTYVGGVLESKAEAMARGYTPARFTLALAAKDLRLVTESAARAGLPLAAAQANRSVYEAAERAGLGELDYSAVIRYLTER